MTTFPEGSTVSVLLPLPLAGAYDYIAGEDLAPGDFVQVPLGRRSLIGVVWGPGSGAVSEKLRPTGPRLDVPPLPESLRNLIDWVANYTITPPGAVLKMAMNVPQALQPSEAPIGYVAAQPEAPDLRLTPARRRVLEAAWAPMSATDLAREAGVGVGTVKTLMLAGGLVTVPLPRPRAAQPDWQRPGPPLSPDQDVAAAELSARVGQGFSVTLLEGVTGSGKTEIYLAAAAETLRQGKQVLVLLPEIALTAQGLARFEARFAAAPTPWHSDLTLAQRRRAWREASDGRARVVVGARSALFLPLAEIGLIVVDEEHDPSFKQEEGVTYNARDMAVVRARQEGIPIVLASATPSLETQQNVEQGRYHRLHLPARHGGASLPDVKLVDLRRTPPQRMTWLSPPLVEAITETMAAGEQSLLFLNRRGYAPLTLCRACGFRFRCPDCEAWLVEHRQWKQLVCHHCGHNQRLPQLCPQCGEEGRYASAGPGVERLAEEVAHRFPEARAEVMASDMLFGPHAAERLVARMERREIDILIGTQIVAKGHHFPMLTLVGVVDGDLGLNGGDLRAGERTFQLLSQVAGRAGREDRPGRVLLQTTEPHHPVMQALASGDAAGFYREEAEQRRVIHMPPFGRLAAIIVSGTELDQVANMARSLARTAPMGEGLELLGPAPAPLSRLRGRHRERLLLKAARHLDMSKLVRGWLEGVKVSGNLRIQVDVDPYSFL